MPSLKDDLYQRIGALGIIVVGVLAILLSRLWFLQIMAGNSYAELAENNRLRPRSVEAPRGLILDRDGAVLVGNRPALAVTVPPKTATDPVLIRRLSRALGVSEAQIVERLRDKRPDPLKPRRIAEDVDERAVTTVLERPNLFPGVEVQSLAIRRYPAGKLAAHVLGYVGELSDAERSDPRFAAYDYGDIVGKTGLEREYEAVLQGTKGEVLLEVDASGRPLRVVRRSEARPGRTIMLTIDRKIQAETETQLKGAIRAAREGKYKRARAGAAVVLDVKTGAVLALASHPTYDPRAFIGGIPTPVWKRLNDPHSEYPLFNRAITGVYPPGSTFKPVTVGAGLATGIISPATRQVCDGKWIRMGEQWPKWCWKRSGHGVVGFDEAMAVSCDVYFYEIGLSFYRRDVEEVREELQSYARRFGFGKQTGIDLAGEAKGRIPDRKWKAEFNKASPEYAPWLPGDTVNLAIGQGDVLATPIQIARLYAAIANGGKLMRPYFVERILTPSGELSHATKPQQQGTLPVSPTQLAAIQRSLTGVTAWGTASGAFEDFPYRVAGKTGTSQVMGKDDYAFFACFAPADAPRYAVMMVVEQGGHGGSIAAPAVRNILATLLGGSKTNARPDDESR